MSASKTAGICLKVLGIAIAVFGYYGFMRFSGHLAQELEMVLLLGVLLLGCFVHFAGRRLAAKARAESPDSPLRKPEATVLYLRSFQSDTWMLGQGVTSEEEQLAKALRRVGELIAIGRPSEKLPLPGAVRMYVSDAEWQSAVTEHMASARVVVLRAGAGNGLFWELREAISKIPPEKLVILVLGIKKNAYHEFAGMAQNDLGIQLPALPARMIWRASSYWPSLITGAPPGFIRFSANWTPEFVTIPFGPLRFRNLDHRAFKAALKPVFENNRVKWQ